MALVSQVYRITSIFPRREIYGLIDQLRRAAVSIPLNIAEGCGCTTEIEFIRFLRISLRSLYELVTGFEIAMNLEYIDTRSFQDIESMTNELGAMINGLINKLKISKS